MPRGWKKPLSAIDGAGVSLAGVRLQHQNLPHSACPARDMFFSLWCLGTPAEHPALAPGSFLLMQPGAQHAYKNPEGQF